MKRMLCVALNAICVAVSAQGQTPTTASGHWRGSINVPDNPVRVELDLARDTKGGWKGTFTSSDVKGLPLAGVTVDGRSLKLVAKLAEYSGTFVGQLSDDGQRLTGTYDTADGNYSIPFAVDRTGEPVIEPAPRNPRVTAALEGDWLATLEINGASQRLMLKVRNQSDGSSSAMVNSVDRAGVDMPAKLTQQDSVVTIEIAISGARFVGTLGADLTGAITQAGYTFPLSFKRVKP